jgi:hypothetical protein
MMLSDSECAEFIESVLAYFKLKEDLDRFLKEFSSLMQARKGAFLSHFCPLLVFIFILAIVSPAPAQWAPPNPVARIQEQADRVLFAMKTGVLKVQICSDSVVHVLYSPTASSPG